MYLLKLRSISTSHRLFE